jgi:hypothetical protein
MARYPAHRDAEREWSAGHDYLRRAGSTCSAVRTPLSTPLNEWLRSLPFYLAAAGYDARGTDARREGSLLPAARIQRRPSHQPLTSFL